MKKDNLNFEIKETFSEKYIGLICKTVIAVLVILQITLIVLRATNVLSWHWAIIFLPTIIPAIFASALVCSAILITLLLNRDRNDSDE